MCIAFFSELSLIVHFKCIWLVFFILLVWGTCLPVYTYCAYKNTWCFCFGMNFVFSYFVLRFPQLSTPCAKVHYSSARVNNCGNLSMYVCVKYTLTNNKNIEIVFSTRFFARVCIYFYRMYIFNVRTRTCIHIHVYVYVSVPQNVTICTYSFITYV